MLKLFIFSFNNRLDDLSLSSHWYFLNFNSIFQTFFRPRLPIDWKTSFYTYLIAFAVDIVGAALITKLGSFILCIMVASFMVTNKFTKDIKQEILTMNENWKTNRNEKELMENMCGIAWFIARINELSSTLNWIHLKYIY